MSDTPQLSEPLQPADPKRARRFATARTIIALMMREMQTSYGRNVGGYLWALLEPVAAITFFVIVVTVGLGLRQPSIGTSFALFYATGFVTLFLYTNVAGAVAKSLQFSGSLLSYPGVEYADALIARGLLAATTQIMVAIILFTLIHTAFGVSSILDVPSIVEGFLLAILLGFGIGTVNCYLFSVLPLWESFWGVLMRPLFVVSGVFFTFDDMPPNVQEILWWNPIIHIVGIVRRGFYATYDAPYASGLYVVMIGLTTLLIGLALLGRYHDDILNR